jgi:hypothetical protein
MQSELKSFASILLLADLKLAFFAHQYISGFYPKMFLVHGPLKWLNYFLKYWILYPSQYSKVQPVIIERSFFHQYL